MTKHLHLYVVSLGALALMLTAVFIGSSGDAGAAPDLRDEWQLRYGRLGLDRRGEFDASSRSRRKTAI